VWWDSDEFDDAAEALESANGADDRLEEELAAQLEQETEYALERANSANELLPEELAAQPEQDAVEAPVSAQRVFERYLCFTASSHASSSSSLVFINAAPPFNANAPPKQVDRICLPCIGKLITTGRARCRSSGKGAC